MLTWYKNNNWIYINELPNFVSWNSNNWNNYSWFPLAFLSKNIIEKEYKDINEYEYFNEKTFNIYKNKIEKTLNNKNYEWKIKEEIIKKINKLSESWYILNPTYNEFKIISKIIKNWNFFIDTKRTEKENKDTIKLTEIKINNLVYWFLENMWWFKQFYNILKNFYEISNILKIDNKYLKAIITKL